MNASLVVVAAGWLLQAAVLLGPGDPIGPAVVDERAFHRVVIDRFASELPRPELSDYAVASAPGYHLAMAVVVRVFDPPLDVLRLLSGQFAVLLAASVAWWCAVRVGVGWALPMGLAVLLVDSMASQAVLLLPEAAAWLLVWLLLVQVLGRACGWRTWAAMGAMLLALVFVRQVHLWAAAFVWMVGWLGPKEVGGEDRLMPGLDELRAGERLPRLGAAALATLPAFGLVGWMFWLWGGPVPPSFQQPEGVPGGSVHSGGNAATPALVLSTFGMLGPLLMLPVLDVLRVRPDLRGRAARLAGLGVCVGLVVSLAVATVYDRDAGRWTGLWDQTSRLPSFADRSLLIAGLSMVGGGLLGAAFGVLASRDRLLLSGTLLAFTAAQSANQQAWIRYVEPMVLFVIAAVVTKAVRRAGVRPSGWTLVGAWIAVTFVALRSLPDLLAGVR